MILGNLDNASQDWKIVPQYKIHAKIDTVSHQQFKIPMVVNYAILENLKEENLVPYYHNIK
jgi:hypothetical protein